MDGHRLLLVDPDEVFSRLVTTWLDARGWAVTWHPRVRDALRHWDAVDPDVVVAELWGDDLDGFDLVEAVRRVPDPPPVLACTRAAGARAWTPDILQRVGLAAVVVRPVRFPLLEQALVAALPPGPRPRRAGPPLARAEPPGASHVATVLATR